MPLYNSCFHKRRSRRHATGIRTIGTRTAGTLGDATALILPGNLPIRFTGDAVNDLDGRRIPGQGITPDIPVSPTLYDLLHDLDPMLGAARALAK
ncbi:hypothetical protein GTP90_01450 [Rugamonas sp. FT81W]|uniref:Tail specific protease domain-containing protein n=1 Tax=Duganella vulcania TaxID=2692166 RepID=A0A845GGI2_9BURK|nr:hypothetical protein [Duganella vulcania]